MFGTHDIIVLFTELFRSPKTIKKTIINYVQMTHAFLKEMLRKFWIFVCNEKNVIVTF